MPECNSPYFGRLVYAEESVFEFPSGLPGFESRRRFLLVEQAVNKPLVFLQSLESPEICFPALPIQAVCPDYRLSLSAEDRGILGFAADHRPVAGRDVLCLAIVSLALDGPPTVNLLSPVVVSWERRRGVQSVQADSGYSHRQPLLALLAEQPC